MTAYYPILLRRITIDSTNKAIRMTENAVTQTVNLVEGTYFLDPNGVECNDAADPDVGASLLSAVVAALDSHTGGTNTYQAAIVWTADPSTDIQATVTISRLTGSNAFALLWENAATTFDGAIIGYSNDTANDTSAKVSENSPTAAWVGDQPYKALEGEWAREYVVTKPASGAARGIDLGGPFRTRILEMQFVSEVRAVWNQDDWGALGGDYDVSMPMFLQRCAGGRVMIYGVETTSGFTLDSPSNYDSVDQGLSNAPGMFVFDEEAIQSFRPQRHSPGLPLYDFSLRLLRVQT